MKNKKVQFTTAAIWSVAAVLVIGLLILHIAGQQPDSISLHRSDENLVNPYVGWVGDAREIVSNPREQFSLVYAGVSWETLEPQKGFYDFTTFENQNNFQYWKDNGVKIIIRLYMDYPSTDSHMDIPQWLYDEMGGAGKYYDIDYGKGFSPDYSNSLLIDYHDKLVEAMAQRYDNMPEIAFIEVGSVGHWGEWHTSIDNNIPFPTQQQSNKYIQPYINGFINKKLLIRRPFQMAKDNKLGLFNDSFGDKFQTEDYFLNWIKNGYFDEMTKVKQPNMQDFWQYAPSGGEVADYPGKEFFTDKNIDRTLEELRKSHTSWLGPSSPYFEEDNKDIIQNLQLVQLNMGYRFYATNVKTLKQVEPGEVMKVELTIRNVGNAPFYYKWPVEFFLLDTAGEHIVSQAACDYDITKIMPQDSAELSTHIKVPQDLPIGEYLLCYGITDPNTDTQQIKFANSEQQFDNKYYCCSIQVGSTNTAK